MGWRRHKEEFKISIFRGKVHKCMCVRSLSEFLSTVTAIFRIQNWNIAVEYVLFVKPAPFQSM